MAQEETILHRIKAYLYDNFLTEDPNDFIARVSSERSLNIGQICTSAVKRGGADISAASMNHAVDLFLEEMAYLLCDGFAVNTGFFTVSVHIKGVFNSPNDSYDPKRHAIVFDFQQGDALRKRLSNVTLDILGVADTILAVLQVTDVRSGSVNDKLTPSRNLKIAGSKIKIAGDNADNGVYFVNQSDNSRIKVDAADIVINNPSELIVVIPSLASGAYRLEVTTQFSSGRALLNKPRTAIFDKLLTAG